MIEPIPLQLIQPNPFQTRLDEDPLHVKKTALSIGKFGLLQYPSARKVTTADGEIIYQLAFGHTRKAAYQFLHDTGNPGFDSMPLNLAELTDLEMFEQAVVENHDRKDLSPIEQALAMETYRVKFNKSSAEIGELFKMSDSAVRNKIRLLHLPEPVRQMVHKGEITEGAGRALLALYDIPEDVRQAVEDHDAEVKPSDIIEAARSGVSPKEIGDMIAVLVQRISLKPMPPGTVELPGFAPAPQTVPVPDPDPEPDVEPEFMDGPEPEITAAPAPVPAPQVEAKPDTKPAPAPTPTASTVRPAAPTPMPAAKPTAPAPSPSAPAPKPAPSPEPAPAPAPAPVTWETSTISINLIFNPSDDDPRGRRVTIGARVNQGLPMMQVFRQTDLELSGPIATLLTDLQSKFGGAA